MTIQSDTELEKTLGRFSDYILLERGCSDNTEPDAAQYAGSVC